MDITSIALLGKGGGRAASLSDFAIVVNSDETARIQEVHLLLGHTFCEYAEISLGIA
jgi:D-sedoheptulose 7-phosphate isomerase